MDCRFEKLLWSPLFVPHIAGNGELPPETINYNSQYFFDHELSRKSNEKSFIPDQIYTDDL